MYYIIPFFLRFDKQFMYKKPESFQTIFILKYMVQLTSKKKWPLFVTNSQIEQNLKDCN